MKEITIKIFKYFKLKDNGNTSHNLRYSKKSYFEENADLKVYITKSKSLRSKNNLINFN